MENLPKSNNANNVSHERWLEVDLLGCHSYKITEIPGFSTSSTAGAEKGMGK